ncbi:transcriptional regulator [Neorhodopirellula lusitana]|uniref:Transcriptional regulator n=1 Tax=Neorhodopirellula lusitana TaxID=445327 RepID=A0ABY1Q302_9BACT|nr:winged helix-turn-helix transcriptional regulator [Neorhodopirellula lusitana]SMP57132.1 transcriptional regulator [Neorhodopirellula lusitana]
MSTSPPTTDHAASAFPGVGLHGVNVRSVDRELLLCLRSGEPKTIGDLTEILGVTATAIRQRIERLLETGLIDREKIVAGRGRPTFRYLLTVAGYRKAGADASDLAEAMWREILELPEGEVRERLVSAIAKRMGQQYATAMDDGPLPVDDDQLAVSSGPFAQRMRQLSAMLQGREIAAILSPGDDLDLPVLDIEACPYPNLTDASDDRTMCRLEEKMLSEALGKEVHLSQCRLDGDSCCQFSSALENQPTQPTDTSLSTET